MPDDCWPFEPVASSVCICFMFAEGKTTQARLGDEKERQLRIPCTSSLVEIRGDKSYLQKLLPLLLPSDNTCSGRCQVWTPQICRIAEGLHRRADTVHSKRNKAAQFIKVCRLPNVALQSSQFSAMGWVSAAISSNLEASRSGGVE